MSIPNESASLDRDIPNTLTTAELENLKNIQGIDPYGDKWTQVLSRLSLTDFLRAPSMACFSSSIGTGVFAGFTAGLVRFTIIRRLNSSLNWAVFSFAGVSLISWEFCRFQRKVALTQLERLSIEAKEREKAATTKGTNDR